MSYLVDPVHRPLHEPAPGLRRGARGRLAARPQVEQDGAGVRGPPASLAAGAQGRALLRLPPRRRPSRSLSALRALRHALGGAGEARRATSATPSTSRRSSPTPAPGVRDALVGRAGEGAPRSQGLRCAGPRLVRRLDPRHGRRDRPARRRGCKAWASTDGRSSSSPPTTARSSSITAACSTGRASTAS